MTQQLIPKPRGPRPFNRNISKARAVSQKGQTLVEFAMAFPLLFALVVGILEMGLAFNAYVTIVYAAREGARAGAIYLQQPACPEAVNAHGDPDFRLASNDLNRKSGNTLCGPAPGPPYYSDNVDATVKRLLGRLDQTQADVDIFYTPDPPVFSNRYGDSLEVVVTYPYRFLTPVLSNASITLSGRASHKIEP